MVAPQEELGQRIENALRLVIDPELGLNIVDLGLVYVIGVNDCGRARILMTTTTRGCPASSFLKDGAREAAIAVPGVTSAEVSLTYDPAWTPEMMTASARVQLGFGPDNDT
ncbi:aromatic ring hydroxylase [Pseudolabrys sp. Root1462]|uniref:metal-sulfur cluster assembly factor n=1 Tax=Pseudolabrys sp. Root1462 TaxID=1736466 RepID=UPI00070310F8|nr:metal-sulfur cluster assembly factor [Pseudolabrys sp. Root1462]KQY99393.1 aromatic ring hydroxylase [Pseudolabrys sp. Root1462]